MSKMTFEDKMNRVEEISALLDSGRNQYRCFD